MSSRVRIKVAVVVVALLAASAALAAAPPGAAAPSSTSSSGAIEDRRPTPVDVPSDPNAPLAALREEGLEPFTLIGLGLEVPTDAWVRVHHADGWAAWQELHFSEDHAEGDAPVIATGGPANSEPVWVDDADGYEILVPRSAHAPVVHLGRDQGAVGAAAATPAVDQFFASSPGIRPRGSWGARPTNGAIVEAKDLRVAFVHHSVTTNTYSPSDVPGILRGIQNYHMDANGWSDIGYNFAVDRFGGIWEAHGGGIYRAIVGGHAAGFNTTSFGVVLLGDFSSSPPPTVMLDAAAELIAWRFAVAGTDPNGTVDFTTSTGSTKYPAGSTVTLDRISGHRDVGLTACPGQLAYNQLDIIRSRARARYPAYAASVPKRWINSPTHRYTDVAGESPDDLDIADTAVNRVSIAVRGLDDALYTTRWDGTRWLPWERVGGILRYGPAIAARNGGLDAFVVGVDGAVYTAQRGSSATAAWSAWVSLGGTIVSRPDAVTMADGSTVLVGRGLDGAVWTRTRSAEGTWDPWKSLGGGTPAGSGPAVATIGGTRVDVLIRGLDNALWTRSNDGLFGTWTAWRKVGGIVTDGPAATGGAESNALDVVVRGSDGRLYASRRTLLDWSGFTPVSKEPVGAAPALTTWGTGRLDLATTSTDGRVFQTWWGSSGGW